MNKTCPISNFTSDGCFACMQLLLSQDSRFNESIRNATLLRQAAERHRCGSAFNGLTNHSHRSAIAARQSASRPGFGDASLLSCWLASLISLGKACVGTGSVGLFLYV